ncbi:glycosyltransferase family 4 protein [Vibrio parahaemolyticus]|uniref:glycosyltransferase family 4 protein n=1 Tax=Vibrio parahaemolyticus TaxID=670 RepID=UPI002E79AB26|nr:sugar transferase [Vibrio parahaemolyticus]
MKVLYLHQYFATPSSNAGTRSYEMAKRLTANGHEVVFVTSSAYLSSDYKLGKGWNVLDIEGIKVHVLHLPYANTDSYMKRISKFLQFSIRASLKCLKIKSDVVLATSTPLTIAIPGILYSKIKRVPMVFEVRDLWPELPIAIGALKNPVVIKLALFLERLAYKNSKRLVGLSPGMCEGIIKQGINSENVILATNSCDTELFDARPGVTGWAQINGRNAISWEEKFALDVWYVDNQTFWLDIKILLLTVKKVFVKEGISADDHVTMPEFEGSKDDK